MATDQLDGQTDYEKLNSLSDIPPEEYQSLLAEAAVNLKKLSPEDYLSMQWYIRDLEDQIRMSDARARVNTVLYGEKGGQIFLEAKGVSISGTVQTLIEEVSRVAGKYGFSTVRPGTQDAPTFKEPPKQTITVSASSVPAAPAAPATQQTVPAPAAPAAPSSQTQATQQETGEMLVVKMEFVPRPDNHGDLLFFQPRHRYKDVSINNWKVEDIVKMLEKTGPWTVEHFSVATVYNVNYIVTWKSGRPSTTGVPYKDVIDIRPA